MTPLRPGVRQLFRLDRWRHDEASGELREEMELHIALRAEQLVRGGMAPADAAAEARRLFAHDDATIGALRDTLLDRNRTMKTRERWEALGHDFRYAARALRRAPAVTAFIVGTLALGIGLNVTAFSIADRLLLGGPQHVQHPESLVRLYSTTASTTGQRTTPWLPHPAFTTWRDRSRSFDGMAAYRTQDAIVGSGAAAETRRVSPASSELFPLLGVRPLQGRFFGAAEDAAHVAVLGERYWRTVLAADPAIIGKAVTVNGVAMTVVGIAPAGFTGSEFRRIDLWTPISIEQRTTSNVEIVARLKPGVTLEEAARDLTRLRSDVEAVLPPFAGWLRGAGYLAAPLSSDDAAQPTFESVMARWLAAISVVILLASCANVANLLLARLARRRRELSVRMALGSGRARVVRLFLFEGLLLAAGAAMLSVAVVLIIGPIAQNALFPEGSWDFTLLDGRIVAATAVLTLLAALLVSLVPAIQSGRRDVASSLRGGSRGGESRSVLRPGLTIVQAMLSVVLLMGAGLFIRSMQRVRAMDLGMDPERVVMVDIRYPRDQTIEGETGAQRFDRISATDRQRHRLLTDAVRRVPGVERAAMSVGVPVYENYSVGIRLPSGDSVASLPGGGPFVTAAGSDYFPTMGTALRRGRVFTGADREGTEPVVIVNEAMAKALWSGTDPVGQCVVIATGGGACARIVGVVANVHRIALREDASMQYYVPVGQEHGFSGANLLVRLDGDAPAAWPRIRAALLDADPAIESMTLQLLSQAFDGEMRPLRLGTIAFGLGAALALIVAGLGLYSIMAHAVAWRRHEIGVRLALGASARSVVMMVVSRGSVLATIGVALGIAVAFGARHWVEPLLFRTSAMDPVVLLSVVGTLEAMVLLAAYVPARRAAGVSPTEALRGE